MTQIDWSKAPEWAGAVIADELGTLVWVLAADCVCLGQYVQNGQTREVDMLPPHCWTLVETRPIAWTGEGLPPVGTVCEFRVEENDWRQCEVIAHKNESAVCWIHCNKILSTGGASVRPIRTPEQIAADKRLHEIRNALTTIHAGRHFPNDIVRGNIVAATVEAMIDAGYRKVEVKP